MAYKKSLFLKEGVYGHIDETFLIKLSLKDKIMRVVVSFIGFISDLFNCLGGRNRSCCCGTCLLKQRLQHHRHNPKSHKPCLHKPGTVPAAGGVDANGLPQDAKPLTAEQIAKNKALQDAKVKV